MSPVDALVEGSADPVSSNKHSVVNEPNATGLAELLLCRPITCSPVLASENDADFAHV